MTRSAALLLFALLGSAAAADPVTLAPVSVTEWKAVYGTVEAKDRIPARARIGGTLVALSVAEGDEVMAGQELARIVSNALAIKDRRSESVDGTGIRRLLCSWRVTAISARV